MKIAAARRLTGFEKCDFDSYSNKCDYCGSAITRHNAENYLRTSFEYDEGDYACNKCVIASAISMDLHDFEQAMKAKISKSFGMPGKTLGFFKRPDSIT